MAVDLPYFIEFMFLTGMDGRQRKRKIITAFFCMVKCRGVEASVLLKKWGVLLLIYVIRGGGKGTMVYVLKLILFIVVHQINYT